MLGTVITKKCIYCASDYSAVTHFGESAGSSGVCYTCQERIDKDENPIRARLILEWEAVRDEMNNGRRI